MMAAKNIPPPLVKATRPMALRNNNQGPRMSGIILHG